MNGLRLLRAARIAVRPQALRCQPLSLCRARPSVLRPLRSYSSSAPVTVPVAEPETEAVEHPKYSITFTCIVPDCGERSSHMFTKHAYHKGIVIIQCPGCKHRHLIADNLGWFKDDRTEEGILRNIEDMARAKGETVTRGRLDAGGVVEYTE